MTSITSITYIREFDTLHEGDDDYIAKAKDECLQFLNWLNAPTLEDSSFHRQ